MGGAQALAPGFFGAGWGCALEGEKNTPLSRGTGVPVALVPRKSRAKVFTVGRRVGFANGAVRSAASTARDISARRGYWLPGLRG